jgi:hypothetical protein
MANGYIYVFNVFSEAMVFFSTNGLPVGEIPAWSLGGEGEPPLYTPASLAVERVLTWNESPGHFCNGKNVVFFLRESGLSRFLLELNGTRFPLSQPLVLYIDQLRWRLLEPSGVVIQDGLLEQEPLALEHLKHSQHFVAHPAVSAAHRRGALMLRFQAVDASLGLYRSEGNSSNLALSLYYLLVEGTAPTNPLPFDIAWLQCSGAYFFLPSDEPITDPAEFTQALKNILGPVTKQSQWLAWIPSPRLLGGALRDVRLLFIAKQLDQPVGLSTHETTLLGFGNMSLVVQEGTRVGADFSDTVPALWMETRRSIGSPLSLRQNNTTRQLDLAPETRITIPLTHEGIGAWSFPLDTNRGLFYELFQQPEDFSAAPSAEVRYTHGTATRVSQLRYPVLLGALPDPRNPSSERLPMQVAIDPLDPTDATRTRFVLDLASFERTGAQIPVSLSFRTPSGHTVRLTPLEGAGFGLGRHPGGQSDLLAPPSLYLTPAGSFEARSAELPGVDRTASPIAENALLIMCGVYGTEFLLAAEQDRLFFTGEQPAHATRFPEAASRPVLDSTSSTNWLKLHPGPLSDKTFKGDIRQSYCVQASDTVYYRYGEERATSLMVGARLGDLSNPDMQRPFPMAPYGQVYYSDPARDIRNPNPDISGAQLTAYETQILSLARRDAINVDRCVGPLFFDMVTLEALAGGYAQTTRGLLVKLNDGSSAKQPAGTWNSLLLARSPVRPDQWLRFDASEQPSCCTPPRGPFNVVSPLLSTALLSSAAFLVVTKPEPLGQFQNKIQLGDFPFHIEVSGSEGGTQLQNNTVLIFKLSTGRSLAQLAGDVAAWTDSETFVGDGTQTETISQQLQNYIQEAEEASKRAPESGGFDYFAGFLERVKSPEWTGVLALNVPLELTQLPIDLQALLGGLRTDRPLRGHHFGINLSQVSRGTLESGGIPIDRSSLFALVHYEAVLQTPLNQPFDFQVLKLNALFDNSTLTRFESQIAFSLQELFGDRTRLLQGGSNDQLDTNTLVIDGALQVRDNETAVVFATNETRIFDFPADADTFRTVSQMLVNHASLNPISRHDQGAGVLVNSAFSLDGRLGFNTRPAQDGQPPIDLFSFGIEEAEPDSGLGYSAYDFAMQTTVTNTGGTLAPIRPDLLGMQLDSSKAIPRESSLFATLPTKLVGFRVDVSPGTAGARQVRGTGLDEGGTLQFALELQLVMGTLGALSDQSPLEGSLLLGWQAAGTAPSVADKTGMLFVPPAQFTSSGGFTLQGVFKMSYASLHLERPELTDDEGSIYVFCLVLVPVDFSIVGLPLVPPAAVRSLTFFGDFDSLDSEEGTNLSWFLGEPDLLPASWQQTLSPRSRTSQRPRKRPALTETESNLVFTPFAGVLAGIRPAVDPQETEVIPTTLQGLMRVPLSTKTTLNDLYNDSADLPVEYDPSAGVTVWFDLSFINITFQGVFSDPAIYGGQIMVASDPNAQGVWKSLAGLKVEVAYRKISDELGAWSVSVTLPDRFRIIEFSKETTLFLPVVGLVIYTNGDWRVDAGWPFSPDSALRLDFTIEGIPFSAAVGFYLAKLRSADDPETFGNEFAVIWRFGVALAFGLAKYIMKGPLILSAALYAFITFEGFLGSKHGALTQYGVDYYWFAGQLGVMVYFWGHVDLKIIKASLYVEAVLSIGWAVETDHKTVLVLQARVTIELSFRLLFINISFDFSAEITLAQMSFGQGPEALTSGPTPTWVEGGSDGQLRQARHYLLEREPKQLDHRLFQPRSTRDVQAPVDVHLLFMLQTTAISDGTRSAPQCIASLVLEVKSSTKEDDFSRLVQGVGQWLRQQYGGAPPLLAQLDRILVRIDDGTFASQLVDCLSSTFRFVIVPSDSAVPERAALFPMFPQLKLTYHGDIPFDQPLLPEQYPAQISEYFNQLATMPLATVSDLVPLEVPGVPRSGAGLIFTDYFDLLGKQLVSELRELAEVDPKLSFEQALSMLGAEGYANIAGTVSRNSQSGLRLPTPGSGPFGATLVSAYQLSRQQVSLQKSGDVWDTTFQLAYGTLDVKSWVVFGTQGDTSVKVTMDPGLVLTEPIEPSWLTSGGGFHQLPPLRAVDQRFLLSDVRTWTRADATTVNLRQLPEALQDVLEQDAPLDVTVQVVKDPPRQGRRVKPVEAQEVQGTPVLFIGLQLRHILSEDTGKPLPGVYQLAGTDEFTRSLLEDLLLEGTLEGASLNMLAPLGSSTYRSSVKDASIVLAKTNLSTLSEPPSVRAVRLARMEAPELPPTHAKLADVRHFLWLVWELSVVHTGGFSLYMEDLPADAFQDGRTDIAVLVSFGGQPVPKPKLRRWHNMLLLPEFPKEDTLGLTATRADGRTLQQSQANYPGGWVGFEIRWPKPPTTPGLDTNPAPAQKRQYLEALYSLLQYRVESLTAPQAHPLMQRTVAMADLLPSHWSLPIGQQQTEDWTYRQTLAVARFLDASNRYAGVGMEARFGVQLVDLFGNNLPTQHPVSLKVIYNDALLPLLEWPGLEATYTFSPMKGKNQALLHLLIGFQPQNRGESTLTPQAATHAREKYLLAKEQLEDPNAFATVSTVLAPPPLGTNVDGRPLKALLLSYINDAALPYLDKVSRGERPPLPEPLQVQMVLDRQYVTTLEKNNFQLDMAVVFWRDPSKVEPAIKSALPTVQQVSSPVAPSSLNALSKSATLAGRAARATLTSGSKEGDDTLRAFAESFERAWAGFDGSQGILKLAEGATAQEVRGTGTNRQLWVVRWGAGAGIDVRFPNASPGGSVNDLPVYFSPIPLSTQLLTQKVEVRIYEEMWTGTGNDVDRDQERSFSAIDLDVWGRDFLNTFQQALEPEMATATATLAGNRFAMLMEFKEQLAGTISGGLRNVLEIPGQSVDATTARERFRQALLQSLTGDYTVASVVQLPAEVTVKDSPSQRCPPLLYGGIHAPQVDSSRVFSLSPAKLAAAPGRIPMPYLLSTKDPAAQAFVSLELSYPVGFVEHDFNPERAHYGYVPSSWLTFISPLFSPSGGRAPLDLRLGKNTIPIPLRIYPGAPTLPTQQAKVDTQPTTIEAATRWAYGFTVSLTPSAQDRLTLQLVFNQPPPAVASPAVPAPLLRFPTTGTDDPPRSPPKDLFEALARFTFEFPQIAPHLAQVPAAAFQGRNVEIAKKALERFESLVQGVCATWKTWTPSLSGARARVLAGSLPNPNLPRERWNYVVDFQELPNLLVTRSVEGSMALPPWPVIEGYETPTSVSEREGTYKAKASFSGSLVVAVPDLSLLARQSARTTARLERNANLVPKGAPAGTTVNRAFIYSTALVELKDPVVPLVDVLNTIRMPKTSTLSQAIDALFAPLIQSNDPSVKLQELRFDLDCAYVYELAKGDTQQSVRSSTPILLMREDVATPDNTSGVPTMQLQEVKTRLTNDLTHWHKLLQPNEQGAQLRFSLTVFSTLEASTAGASPQDLPLARFRSLEVPVPKNDPGWWNGTL